MPRTQSRIQRASSPTSESSSDRSKGRRVASGARKAAGGTGRLILIVVGAVIIGLGVPALWFWIGGQLGGDFRPGEYLSPQTFAAIIPGMLITYVVVLDICSWIYNRSVRDEDVRERAWPVRRASWNRSMRDERYRPGQQKLSSVEIMFMVTATGASIAFTVWFFLFAKSPL